MRVHRLLGALAVGALLQACWDDPESPPNRPPDLRMEDVVGCWTEDGKDLESCTIQCFDPGQIASFQRMSPSWGRYENLGQFTLSGWEIYSVLISRVNSGDVDSVFGKDAYRRASPDLYTLTYDLQLGTRYTPVNLDSTLPCGTPFQLLPKPEGWTLF